MPAQRFADQAGISLSKLYQLFRDLDLPTRTNDRPACQQGLKEAIAESGGKRVSWHAYERSRREHPDRPCASTVERVLGGGSWTTANLAAGAGAKRRRVQATGARDAG